MSGWTKVWRFEDYHRADVIDYLIGQAGVYQFGFNYDGFQPKYIGRVVWTAKKWDFYKRFEHYRLFPHNSEIAKRIFNERKSLKFRIQVVSDPAWTESKYLMDDKNTYGQFKTYQWNRRGSNYSINYEKDDWEAWASTHQDVYGKR